MLSAPCAFSLSDTASNRVTIRVPSYLFIEADQKDVNLLFSDYRSGSESNTETVSYRVMGNSLGQSDGAPVVTAKLDGDFPNIDFQVRMGNYTKDGGNTELGPVSSNFISLNESETPIAKKNNSVGDGKVLKGQMAVDYKAVAKNSLIAGEYTKQLTLTFTDI